MVPPCRWRVGSSRPRWRPSTTPRPHRQAAELDAPASRSLVTVIGTVVVTAALVLGLWNKRHDFAEAFASASALTLGLAIGTQVIWLLARSEAWHVCVEAAGGRVDRRAPVPGRRRRLRRQPLQPERRARAADRGAAPLRARPQPAAVGADRGRAADRRHRDRARRDPVLHADLPARHAVVGGGPDRHGRHGRDRAGRAASSATAARASGRGSRCCAGCRAAT